MKSFLNSFMAFCEAFGTARAATYLARSGHHKAAVDLYKGN